MLPILLPFLSKLTSNLRPWLFFHASTASHQHQLYGVTSGFTRLNMKTNYVWHRLIGYHVKFISCIENLKSHAPVLLAHKSLAWKFNPRSAPHHGGVWEKLVRSIKSVFFIDILATRQLTEEVLLTTFCLVEQSLNNRPPHTRIQTISER